MGKRLYILMIIMTLSVLFGTDRVESYDMETTPATCCCLESDVISDGYLVSHEINREYYCDAVASSNVIYSGAGTYLSGVPVKVLGSDYRTGTRLRLMSALLSSLDNSYLTQMYHDTNVTTGVMNMSTSGYVTYCLKRIII